MHALLRHACHLFLALLMTGLIACQSKEVSEVVMAEIPSVVLGNNAFTDGVDTSCRTDADCTVKDIGSCCGYYPACVNINSPTFPERARAICAESGTSGTCGFPAIQQCQCVENRCEALMDAVLPDSPSIR